MTTTTKTRTMRKAPTANTQLLSKEDTSMSKAEEILIDLIQYSFIGIIALVVSYASITTLI